MYGAPGGVRAPGAAADRDPDRRVDPLLFAWFFRFGGRVGKGIDRLELAVQMWRRWKREQITNMLDLLLPYQRVLLANYLIAVYFLLLSALIDLLALLVSGYSALEGAASAGT